MRTTAADSIPVPTPSSIGVNPVLCGPISRHKRVSTNRGLQAAVAVTPEDTTAVDGRPRRAIILTSAAAEAEREKAVKAAAKAEAAAKRVKRVSAPKPLKKNDAQVDGASKEGKASKAGKASKSKTKNKS